MLVRIFLFTICAFCLFQEISSQTADTFPEYVTSKIGDVRLDFARVSRFEDGIRYLREWKRANTPAVTHQDSAASYAIDGSIAYTFFDLRQMDSAEVVLLPDLDISPERFPIEYLMIQNAWGVRLIYGGRFADAKPHYEKLRAVLDAKIIDVTPLQYCNVVHNLGVANFQLGDYDGALEVFHHIEDYVRDNDIKDNRLLTNLHLNMAGSYSHLSDNVHALEHAQKAHDYSVAEYGYYHVYSAQSLNSVANSSVSSGDFEGAIEQYKEVLSVFDKLGRNDHPLRTIAMLNIAETLDKLGRSEEAMEYIVPCIEIRKAAYGLRHAEVARAYKAKGKILSHLDRFDEALTCLDTALMALGYDATSENPYSGVDAMFNLFYTLDHRADIYYDQVLKDPSEANLQSALSAYVQGIQVLNDLRVHFKGKLSKGSLNEKSYMFYEPAIDVCLRLYDKTGDTKYLDQALEWSSESKGNDFYDLVRGEQAMLSTQVPDSVRQKDDAYQQELATLESSWYDARDDQEKLIVARQELDSVKSAYRVWLTAIETEYPKYFELLHANSGTDVKSRRKSLRQSASQFVEYFLGDSNAYAFVLNGKEEHFIRLAHPDLINNTVRRWKQDVTGSNDGIIDSISQLVWTPVRDRLSPGKHLIIIPDGVLSSVPFEILTESNGGLALEDFDISYDYSSRMLSTRSRHSKSHRWLGMAPAYNFENGGIAMASRGLDSAALVLRGASWISLPGAAAEVNTIADLTGGQRRIGAEATEAYFRSEAAKYGILHLSMHAWTDDDEPLLSTLIFSHDPSDSTYDGSLYAHEIFQMDLPARLAVLSACNTGVGSFRRGEGISSLARAFMYAGTEATVMSLWKVPDQSTAVIMEAFYKHLRNGKRKDEALRNAKLDYLNSAVEPELKRPYYWAGFVLMGDPSPVYRSTSFGGVLGLLCGIFLLGAVLFRIRRGQKRLIPQ